MNSRDKYRLVCERDKSIPLFSQAWWLDSLAGTDGWDVCIVEKGGEVVAAMPYTVSKINIFSFITRPVLTKNLGPWIKASNAKYTKQLSRQKDLMRELIDQLPQFDYFLQNWEPEITNWLPFYWQGFEQTTQYTYRLDDLSDLDCIWQNLQDNIRREIRKAEGRFNLKLRYDLSIADLLKLNRLTFERQNKKLPFDEYYVIALEKATSARNCSRIIIAQDEEGRHHAGAFIVWDEHNCYYLIGGGDPELRNSGAMSLCIWDAIKHSASVSRKFDFEGSMVEPIERFFRGFGAKQIPYFSVSKSNSKLFEFLKAMKSLIWKK